MTFTILPPPVAVAPINPSELATDQELAAEATAQAVAIAALQTAIALKADKAEIPPAPNLSNYALKSEIPAVPSTVSLIAMASDTTLGNNLNLNHPRGGTFLEFLATHPGEYVDLIIQGGQSGLSLKQAFGWDARFFPVLVINGVSTLPSDTTPIAAGLYRVCQTDPQIWFRALDIAVDPQQPIKPWAPNEEVTLGAMRFRALSGARVVLWANGTRRTGATFDMPEPSSWLYLGQNMTPAWSGYAVYPSGFRVRYNNLTYEKVGTGSNTVFVTPGEWAQV